MLRWILREFEYRSGKLQEFMLVIIHQSVHGQYVLVKWSADHYYLVRTLIF